MPKCTAERMEFGRVGRRVIEADFTGGAMGSEGGVLKLIGHPRQCPLVSGQLAEAAVGRLGLYPDAALQGIGPDGARTGQSHHRHIRSRLLKIDS